MQSIRMFLAVLGGAIAFAWAGSYIQSPVVPMDPSTVRSFQIRSAFIAGAVIYAAASLVAWLMQQARDVETQAAAAAQRQSTDEAVAQSALLSAVRGGDRERVQSLLAAGESPNQAAPDGTTPLILAAKAGIVPVIDALLDAGADVNQGDREGLTALAYSCEDATGRATRCLTERGAAIDAVDTRGNTPLMLAAGMGAVESIKFCSLAEQTSTLPPGPVTVRSHHSCSRR